MTARDIGACYECGAPATEMAHVVPRLLGGTKTIPLCGRCHGLSHGMARAQDIGRLTRMGMQFARERGVRIGRPRVMSAEAIRLILDLRAEGLSMAKIADELNDRGVPTAHGGARWYVNTIKRVLDREKAEGAA